jgi:hypothetical protein
MSKGLSGAYPTGHVQYTSKRAGGCSVQIRQEMLGTYPTGRGAVRYNPTRQGRGLSGAYPTGNVRYISDRAGSCSVQSDRAGVCPVHIRQETCKGVPYNFFAALFYLKTYMCIKLTQGLTQECSEETF